MEICFYSAPDMEKTAPKDKVGNTTVSYPRITDSLFPEITTNFRDKIIYSSLISRLLLDEHNFTSKKEIMTSATREDPLFFMNRVKN